MESGITAGGVTPLPAGTVTQIHRTRSKATSRPCRSNSSRRHLRQRLHRNKHGNGRSLLYPQMPSWRRSSNCRARYPGWPVKLDRVSGATRASRKNFLVFEPLGVQRKQTRRFSELSAMNILLLLVIALLFLSGSFVNGGPVGDFFKKVGHSISKPLQREPQPEAQRQPQQQRQSARPQPAKPPQPTRRSTSQAGTAAAATPRAAAETSQPPKEEESTATVRSVSAADLEKIKANLPYGIPVPGRKGMVTSPYTPDEGKYVDVTGFASGSLVKDPYTGKFFLVP